MERERDMLVAVDQETCIGCGQCAAFAPEVFGFASSAAEPAKVIIDGELMVEGVVSVSVTISRKVMQASVECPVSAISADAMELSRADD